MEEKDSNNLKTTIHWVCSPCGIEANRLTCLKRYGAEPLKKAFSVSTFHQGICDNCKEEKPITQTRDFFYPDFSSPQPDESMEERFDLFLQSHRREPITQIPNEVANFIRQELSLSHSQTIDKILGEIEKMETQKFLDKICEVSDFIKLDDIISIIKGMK